MHIFLLISDQRASKAKIELKLFSGMHDRIPYREDLKFSRKHSDERPIRGATVGKAESCKKKKKKSCIVWMICLGHDIYSMSLPASLTRRSLRAL